MVGAAELAEKQADVAVRGCESTLVVRVGGAGVGQSLEDRPAPFERGQSVLRPAE